MKVLKLLGVAWLYLLFQVPTALCQPNFTIGSASGAQNDVVTIDVTVSNFTDLVGIEFRLEWDASVAEFVSINNINSALSGSVTATPPAVSEGRVVFNWFSASTPTSIVDNEIFYSVELRLVGASGSSSTLSFFDNPDRLVAITASDPTTNIGVNFTSGNLEVSGGGGPNPTLTMGSLNAMSGDEFCLGVSVRDFTNVTALQFDLGWDPSVIEFTGLQNFNLNGLGADDFNVNGGPTGNLLMGWISPIAGGETLENNTEIFELCFRATGASGTSTSVNFSNIITVPDFTTVNGQVNIQGGVSGFALIGSNGANPPGQTQCLDISVNGFDQIQAFQFSMNWDSTLFKYQSIMNVNPILANNLIIGDLSGEDISEGQINAAWFVGNDVTLDDGAVLFTLCLDGPTDCDSSVPVRFTETPTDIVIVARVNEVSTQLADNQITLIDGSVTVDCASISSQLDQLINPVCNGELSGSIFVTILPANGDYSFTWNGQTSSTEDLENVAAGNYQLIVTDNSTSMSQSFDYEITQPESIVIDGSSQDPTEAGDDGSITINSIAGGTGTLTCLWDPNISDNCEGATGLSSGSYNLTVVDENDCSASLDFELVGVITMLSISTQPTDATCMVDGICDGSIVVSITTGQGSYTMTIDGTPFDGTANNLCPGDYSIQVIDEGLNETADEIVTVVGPDPIEAVIDITSESAEDANDGMAIVTNISGGVAPYDIIWQVTASDTLANVGAGIYLLQISDANGCVFEQMIEIAVGNINDPGCFVGRAVVTPNGDGKNDELVIRCVSLRSNEIQIFNRWGQLVHQQTNYDDTWNGTDLNGNMLPDDVYFWVLIVQLDNGTPREIEGYVNLIRNLN